MLMIENLTKAYGEKLLFKDVQLTITDGARIGLIGVNGTGKSTLLKIIAGKETSDTGQIHYPKEYEIAYLDQNPEFVQEQTVLEYIFAGDSVIMKVMRAYETVLEQLAAKPNDTRLQTALLIEQQEMDKHGAWEANTKAKAILTKLGVTGFHQNVTQLSGGQKKRVAIARALIQPVDLLILDEPTNHLDNETIAWLEQHVLTYQGALLFVTHDRYFLNRVAKQMIELDKGQLYAYEGNYELFLEKKLEREELEKVHEQKHRNTLKNELAWLRRGARARSTKQRARIERIDQLKNRTFQTKEEQVEFQVSASRLGKQVIELTNVGKSFDGQDLFRDVDLLITPGDRIGIIGPNGAGKTTLLEIIAERILPDTGIVKKGETVKIAYYTQGEEELDGNLRLIEYIKKTAQSLRTKDGEHITVEQMLERFLFPRPKQWTKIERLSGGEKRRLYLLKVLMTEPNVILLDEPTNDLDTQTLSILEDYLAEFPGVVITVSHDRYFLDMVVDQLLIFDGKTHIDHFYGNYSEYRESEAKRETMIQKKQPEVAIKPKAKKKLSYHEQKEWESIEDEITKLENKIAKVKGVITEQGSDYEQVQQLFVEQEQLEKALEEKMLRWEELTLLVESFGK
jgi:ATP-binding cassette subfamily F protein uup